MTEHGPHLWLQRHVESSETPTACNTASGFYAAHAKRQPLWRILSMTDARNSTQYLIGAASSYYEWKKKN